MRGVVTFNISTLSGRLQPRQQTKMSERGETENGEEQRRRQAVLSKALPLSRQEVLQVPTAPGNVTTFRGGPLNFHPWGKVRQC